MPLIEYVSRRFGADSQALVDACNNIITEYQAQGFKLTLRQLYYQCVRRIIIPNTMRSYKRLGSIVNDARMAGLIDWDAIEDRTREVVRLSHWNDPSELVGACAQQFRIDKWADQEFRPEVWIEKEALSGVVEGPCRELQIPYLSCRGYTSQSEMWGSAGRLKEFCDAGQKPIILHFGDLDPSGIDMTRDIESRMATFGCDVEIQRMALNMSQINKYKPPPNPAKTTDSRFESYRDKFGDESWELDALEPRVIAAIIRDAVLELRDEDKWDAMVEVEDKHKQSLGKVAKKWDKITKSLK